MLDFLDLIDDQLNARHEALGIVIMHDIHIYTLVAAREECIAVLIGFNAASYSSKYQGARIDGFEVAARHLKNHRKGRRQDGHQFCATFDAAAALICLRFVSRYFEL